MAIIEKHPDEAGGRYIAYIPDFAPNGTGEMIVAALNKSGFIPAEYVNER